MVTKIKEQNSLKLSETESGIEWLSQFELVDIADATNLIDAIRWVSSAEFNHKMREGILNASQEIDGKIGVFLERKIRRKYGISQRFYKETKKSPKRAFGLPLQPIESVIGYLQSVGSVGITGNIATNLQREYPKKYIMHPSAEHIRKYKLRAFFILTDNIGTGDQMRKYLDSLWRVHSIQSWISMKFIRVFVIAFSATGNGARWVKSHKSKPTVIYAHPCPSLEDEFDPITLDRLKKLCHKYDPSAKSPWGGSLGYGSESTLIAFAHGIPNNAPKILHATSDKWKPLFPSRSASGLSGHLSTSIQKIDETRQLEYMGQKRLAGSKWLHNLSDDAKNIILIMASLSRPPRTNTGIAARTKLDIYSVNKLLAIGQHYEWITKSLRLTDEGINLLAQMKGKNNKSEVLFKPKSYYYPKSLRMPG